MTALRRRVRRLEERLLTSDQGTLTVAALEAARCGGSSPPWPPREDLERDAAGGGWRATLAEARLRVLCWSGFAT